MKQQAAVPDNSHRPRCRELGVCIGSFPTGTLNAITDVKGVLVGHCTLYRGDGPLVIGQGPVRTGVTVVLPHASNPVKEPVEAAAHVFNGAGTTTGLSLLYEYGILDTPICLTSTLSVGAVYDALAHYVSAQFIEGPDEKAWFNPVVGETDDSFLNDVHGFHVREEHVLQALSSAVSGPVAEGVVGAGTGISTCSFKSGIGSASRVVELEGESFLVGVLVQSNFRGALVIDGVPVGDALQGKVVSQTPRGGSLMVIIATDCPLDSRQLRRLAVRGVLGMARTGALGSHSSGDYFIAFSTTYRKAQAEGSGSFFSPRLLRDDSSLTPLLPACAEAVEEAILNSLFKAVTVVGRDGNQSSAIDLDAVQSVLRAHGRRI